MAVVFVCTTDWLAGVENDQLFRRCSLVSSFLEVRVSGARLVMTGGEYRVESVSNVCALVHPCCGKLKSSFE